MIIYYRKKVGSNENDGAGQHVESAACVADSSHINSAPELGRPTIPIALESDHLPKISTNGENRNEVCPSRPIEVGSANYKDSDRGKQIVIYNQFQALQWTDGNGETKDSQGPKQTSPPKGAP
ncbi:UNVERIFIED_CONTAM: hypothetical protein Sradi_1582900 [Sesamum radiatum]|uniref:Uncharacterized protein n=1 Tax=Sesamum radiatum TaxID=300843 RepID=A0AAW2UAS8_SESRA